MKGKETTTTTTTTKKKRKTQTVFRITSKKIIYRYTAKLEERKEKKGKKII